LTNAAARFHSRFRGDKLERALRQSRRPLQTNFWQQRPLNRTQTGLSPFGHFAMILGRHLRIIRLLEDGGL